MSHSLTTAYIRVASTSIAAYDYLRTFPTAYRFYATQWNNANISVSLCLFILIRIMSISVLTLSNIGFFYSKFTAESCSRFYLLPAIFKVLQIMVSQCIMAVRTYNLSRRSTSIGFLVIMAYFVACGMQWYSNLAHRSPEFDSTSGDCLATLVDGHHIGGWFYYVVSIVYDLIMTLISVYYLLKYKLTLSNTSTIFKLADSMLYDGLGYFVILTATNAVNLMLFRSSEAVQGAAVTVGYIVTWIMSQKLLINLHKARMHRRLADEIAMGATVQSRFKAPQHGAGIDIGPWENDNGARGRTHITESPIGSGITDRWTVPEFYDLESSAEVGGEAGLGGGIERGELLDTGAGSIEVAAFEGDEEPQTHSDIQVRLERSVCIERVVGHTRAPASDTEHAMRARGRWGG